MLVSSYHVQKLIKSTIAPIIENHPLFNYYILENQNYMGI